MTDEPQTPAEIAVAFIKTMESNDMSAAARYVADDVVFEGPMTQFASAEPYLEAMGQFSQVVSAIEIRTALGDDDQAIVVYEMETGPFGTVRAMEHFVVRDRKIATDTLVFDTYAIRSASAVAEPAET
jgi:limonene-1,2-epoxide hydrolase